MSYEFGLIRIKGNKISRQELQSAVSSMEGLTYDDQKTWTNLYDVSILYTTAEGKLDFLIGYSDKSDWISASTLEHPKWKEQIKLADMLDAFVIGEENEVYHFPNLGQPSQHLNFDALKAEFQNGKTDFGKYFVTNQAQADAVESIPEKRPKTRPNPVSKKSWWKFW